LRVEQHRLFDAGVHARVDVERAAEVAARVEPVGARDLGLERPGEVAGDREAPALVMIGERVARERQGRERSHRERDPEQSSDCVHVFLGKGVTDGWGEQRANNERTTGGTSPPR
jgi:hypothetical protein